MANDAVAMLKSSQVEESQGKRVVVAMRGARRKKPGRKALLADTRRAGLFVVSAWLARRWCTSKRQARKVCSADGCG